MVGIETASDDLPPFTGGRFERIGGGGGRLEVRDIITADDLLAVEMLSVRVPPRVALDLLEGGLGRAVGAELRGIPTDLDLGTGGARKLVEDGGPADRAWQLLANSAGVGWVIAGKVLARKRPRVIPIYDDVVRCAYGTGKGFWCWLDTRLRQDGNVLLTRLGELRAEAALPSQISALRVLDVVIWMRHHRSHAGYRCPGMGVPRPTPGG